MERYSLLSGKSEMHFNLEKPLIMPKGMNTGVNSNTPREALRKPFGSPALEVMAERWSAITIVLPDATRSWQDVRLMAEAVRSSLENVESLNWVIGGGQHRLPTEEEITFLLGNAMREKDHVYCHDPENYVHTGKLTSRGNAVTLHPKVYEAEMVVLIGGIIYHDLAGFSGGRKAIIPGVSGRGSIIRNHSLCLDNGSVSSSIGCGRLKGNPVHEDMMEYADLAMKGKDVFILNVIPDQRGMPWRYVAGDLYAAWEKGIETAEALQTLWVDKKADWAIVSSGGYPYDIDLYQATKSVSAALGALKEGGTIIMVAELEDGLGPGNYGDALKRSMLDPGKILEELEDSFTIPVFCAFKLVLDLEAHPAILVTPKKEVPFPGLSSPSIQGAFRVLEEKGLLDGDGLILPAGNCVVLRTQ